MLDHTHRADLRSWVDSANDPAGDFPIQNLPLGIVRLQSSDAPAAAVAIGDQVLVLSAAVEAGLLTGLARDAVLACQSGSLNGLMALGPAPRRALRVALVDMLATGTEVGRRARAIGAQLLVSSADAEPLLPAVIGDYTDFYASIHHATNIGSMFRPDNPLLPNYKWIPIGYHGRASSIVVSGQGIVRPIGQTKTEAETQPTFGPTRRLDYELEVAAFVGTGNRLGHAVPISEAEDRLFGLCLLNDWSARDVQAWEYQPLGPFLAKNFATTISPWIVTLDALEPFRSPALRRPPGDPRPLPYLYSDENAASGSFDIHLEVWLASEQMRAASQSPVRLSRGRFTDMYWTIAQLVTHHAGNGCNLSPGDVLASGTVSGASKESRGCMQELTWRGTEPITLPSGEQRRFLEDGDEVILRGYCERFGVARIGFGECRGTILPAIAAT